MAGSKNDVVVGKNADFSQAGAPNSLTSESNGLVADGNMWIGSTALNAGNTHINVGTITSPLGTLSVGYSSPNITLDLAGGSTGIDSIGVQGASPPGTNPVVPTVGGQVDFEGSIVAAGTSPLLAVSVAANKVTYQAQLTQAIAAADNTKVGLANFDSASFSVSDGFVTASGTGLAKTITGDSGGALSPTAGNWNILGLSGSKTSGSGSTLTIKSPPYADSTAATLTVNSGTFATAAGAYVLPASPAVGDLVEIVCITTGIVVTANTGQKIQMGGDVSSTAGTVTNSAKGDVLCLRYRATDAIWYSTSAVGVWTLA